MQSQIFSRIVASTTGEPMEKAWVLDVVIDLEQGKQNQTQSFKLFFDRRLWKLKQSVHVVQSVFQAISGH